MVDIQSAIACATIMAAVIASPAGAQPLQRRAPRQNVRQAALEQVGSSHRERRATFGRRAPRVGDRIEQAISLQMQLTTSMRQGTQILEKSQTTMRNHQRRLVTTTSVNQGLADAVTVHYLDAKKHLGVHGGNQLADELPSEPQPVKGKTYRCRREGGSHGKLKITDAAGHIPPSNEYEIVAQNMEMVGRSNPLAEFLAGRTVSVGETISLPRVVARRLFNLGERYGEVLRFDLTLQESQADEPACAVFLARVEAASNDASQMRLDVEGPMVVELATCRVVRTDWSGPIGLSETRGSYSTAHQLIGTGRLKMSIASIYRDAAR